jgi:uncharacterized surface protein with fasciclin (FAS1) repeats
MCLAGFVAFSCSDKYDLDSEQPSNLNTIYGYMEDKGNFKNFLHLIDDLGETEILSKTGSKTLFVADDAAFAQFYASNDWGVKSYEDLSTAQKSLLLYSAMIDNPYPTSMLSTAQGPVKGEVCRRTSSQSLFDSVQVVSTLSDELPQNDRWSVLQSTHPEIVLFKDASGAPPMVHFTPKFLSANKIESTDVDFLYNDAPGTRQSDDTYVNRAKIKESQFCKNGFVHVVDRVITPLDNMAEIIRKNPRTHVFSSIIERFAAPKDSTSLKNSYNQVKGTDVDSVYVKRYFSNRSWGSGTDESSRRPFSRDKDGNTFDAALKFDPGWNTFVPEIFNNRNALMEDMAVMIVPSDEAVADWWNNGGGAVIKAQYGTIENTPNSVLDDLINVNMLNSLVSSVPSRFSTVLNDAGLPIGITTSDVDSVLIGCNGAVFLTNRVFSPASYSSVLFPTVIDTENLNIIKNAIDNLTYDAYLNSMVSRYSFFIPTNDGLLSYIDPVSYGKAKTTLWEFHFDPTKAATARIYADTYEVDTATWEKGAFIAKIEGGTGNTQIRNRIEDLLDNIIGVELAENGHHYIITKGKNYVKVNGNSPSTVTEVAGSFQMEQGKTFPVKEVFKMENGYAYVIDGAVVGTRKATSDILAERPEFSDFYSLMVESELISTTNTDGYSSASQNVGGSVRGNLVSPGVNSAGKQVSYSLLNAFHYTVYAPTNAAMQLAYAAGLPTLEDLAAAELYDEEQAELDNVTDSAAHVKSIIRDFIKYHVQSNSIYMDGGFKSSEYETSKAKLEFQLDDAGNPITTVVNGVVTYSSISGSPYRITVTNVDANGITLRDAMGNTVNVVKQEGLYNLMGREYWLNNTSVERATMIQNSSSVVVHAIDRPLLYDADQFRYIPRKVVADESAKTRK